MEQDNEHTGDQIPPTTETVEFRRVLQRQVKDLHNQSRVSDKKRRASMIMVACAIIMAVIAILGLGGVLFQLLLDPVKQNQKHLKDELREFKIEVRGRFTQLEQDVKPIKTETELNDKIDSRSAVIARKIYEGFRRDP